MLPWRLYNAEPPNSPNSRKTSFENIQQQQGVLYSDIDSASGLPKLTIRPSHWFSVIFSQFLIVFVPTNKLYLSQFQYAAASAGCSFQWHWQCIRPAKVLYLTFAPFFSYLLHQQPPVTWIYLSQFLNVFVPNTNLLVSIKTSICPNSRINFSKFLKVFVPNANYIFPKSNIVFVQITNHILQIRAIFLFFTSTSPVSYEPS